MLNAIESALKMAFLMGWEILWALILGFWLSAVIQAVVSKEEMGRLLPDDSPRTIVIACGLGAASSSCSYHLHIPCGYLHFYSYSARLRSLELVRLHD